MNAREGFVKPILGRYYEHTYELLRIFTGAMFMFHGTQKILGWPPPQGGHRAAIASMIGVSGIIELITGALVMIGLFTTIAAFVASGEMAVAYLMTHAPKSFLPNVNQGEAAVLYCFIFLFIAANGGGLTSVDRLIFGRKATASQAVTTTS